MASALSLSRSKTKTETPISKRGFRPDIQGLRAFAVIAVILDHLLGWPSGGFVGVDIFFVISGFLITGHLMREWEKTGTISFKGFYKRRVKRILPASALVLAVTVGASFLLLNNTRAMSILWDGVWAALFAGNWRFASAGTDYFQSDGPVSPLQHFWSLAVEEQFYFVWPLVMLVVLMMASRGVAVNIAPRVAAGTGIAILSSASLLWALHETESAPTIAYFSTLSRTWELGIGALLAIGTPLLMKIPNVVRPALAWIGLVGMLASLFVISEDASFPAPSALLPVLATGCVIAAGAHGQHRFLAPLTNPASIYIGNISYSLYLWHFPVIILMSQFISPGPTFVVISLALMGLLSVYAYHLVEDPIRRSGWLDGDRPARKKEQLETFSSSYRMTALSLLIITAAGTTALAFSATSNRSPDAISAPRPASTPATELADTSTSPELGTLQTQIQQALMIDTWPELSPSMDEALSAPRAPGDIDACGKAGGFNEERCTFGEIADGPVAVVLGDSISMTMANPIRLALGPGWNVVVGGMYGCPFSSVTVKNDDPRIMAGCPNRNNDGVELVNRLKPDLVIVSNTYEPRALANGTSISPLDWSESVRAQAAKLEIESKRVAFFAAPPADKDPARCFNALSAPADCISSKTDTWLSSARFESGMASAAGFSYVDTSPLFCAGARCPAFVGATPMKSDRGHITVPYGGKAAPALAELLKDVVVK